MRIPSLWSAPVLVGAALLASNGDLLSQRGRGGLDGWVNEDIGRGVQLAKQTGKPLMVVFRCPP